MEGLRSSAYIATGEPDTFWMVVPCSSFTCQRLWRMTSKVTGSTSSAQSRWSFRVSEMRSASGGT